MGNKPYNTNEDKFNLILYETEAGKCPIKQFVQKLNKKDVAKVLYYFDLLQTYGNQLGEPYSKYLCDGIFELRFKLNKNNIRILYFFENNRIIVLTSGFMKKTQKAPVSEIAKAKKYKKDFERRKSNVKL